MDRPLGPLPNWNQRRVLFVLLSLPALILPGVSWLLKPLAVAFVACLVGSARESRVVSTELVTQQFVAFVPLQPQRCKLKFIVQIEAENRKSVGAIDWILFLGFNWFMDHIMQWIWPWMAGELELWVVTARERKLLAWRGNGDADFQANLAILTSATGAPVKRR